MYSLFVLPMLSMFALTNCNHSTIAPAISFTADRFTKVQSQEAGSDLETVLMQNQK